MLSYWEQQSFSAYDHVVVGAGIVGLSAALELRERMPSARILVLERGLLPTGASSRNAGFACMGSVTELLDDLQTMPEDKVVALFEARKKGLERLRNRLGDQQIGYAEHGSYELIGEQEAAALDQIGYLNKLLLPVTGKPAFRRADHRIQSFGFNATQVRAVIENTCEGEVHTGRLLRTLLDQALRAGIEVKTGASLRRFEERERQVLLEIDDPLRHNVLVLQAGALVICTNAFTRQLLPEEQVSPGRGQVLITHPIPGLALKGIFHMERGYFYFREIDGRILFGGGRNLDFSGESTTDMAITEKIQVELERRLHEIIIPGIHFHISQRWSGIMAFGADKQPVVRAYSDRVFGAFRLGGMGVALGSQVAMQVADLVLAAGQGR